MKPRIFSREQLEVLNTQLKTYPGWKEVVVRELAIYPRYTSQVRVLRACIDYVRGQLMIARPCTIMECERTWGIARSAMFAILNKLETP